ncbi:hypothetical protein BCR37DRAFT_20931 [Protomyces lactucae-debilis]|uniref:Uncharacterized protein n=1 Tax=Protomyces lactucae-debilis TaxID=2754530 RepID=A0A1Y2FE38_PROLT|nr:uncharacterized protein BCR37DRAFT_20931 [Protomyces lactucae-debilis]ORY81887.1 hypothetical protein BCR37DRAFT_20931 [Protomyces lactucae-debilis]
MPCWHVRLSSILHQSLHLLQSSHEGAAPAQPVPGTLDNESRQRQTRSTSPTAGDGLCTYLVDESMAGEIIETTRRLYFGYHPWTSQKGIENMVTLNPGNGNDHLPVVLACVLARNLPNLPNGASDTMHVCTSEATFPWPDCVKSQNVLLMLFNQYQLTRGVPIPEHNRFKEFGYKDRKFYVPDVSLFNNNSARMQVDYFPLDANTTNTKATTIESDQPDTYKNLACWFGSEASHLPKVSDELFCADRGTLPAELSSYFCLLEQNMQYDSQDQNSKPEPKIRFHCDSADNLARTNPPSGTNPPPGSNPDDKELLPDGNPVADTCAPDLKGKYTLLDKTKYKSPYFNYYIYTDLQKIPANVVSNAFISIRRDLSALDDHLVGPLYCVEGHDPSALDNPDAKSPICVYDPRDWPDCFVAHCVITLDTQNNFVPRCMKKVVDTPSDCPYRAPHDMLYQPRTQFEYFEVGDGVNPFHRYHSNADGKNNDGSLQNMQCALKESPIQLVKEDNPPRRALTCWPKDTKRPLAVDDCLKTVCTFTIGTVDNLGTVFMPNCDNVLPAYTTK